MASSSRGSEGANKIPEDLVLSWTRDETTSKMFATFLGNDRQLLQELIQGVHEGKDANGTKQKLSTLLGTGRYRESVVIRARVLARLISIALGLHPDDITVDSQTGKESLRPSMDFKITLHQRLAKALQDDSSVLSYLFKDALEADDEVMTVMCCNPRFFEMYPIPYFHGCDLAVVQEISKLWLSQEIGRGFYYSAVWEPLFNQSKEEARSHKISEENGLEVCMVLCELLQKRTEKAGARLLQAVLRFSDYIMFEHLECFRRLVTFFLGLKNGKFRKCFLGDFQNRAWIVRWLSRGSDQVLGRHGQSIVIGPSSAQTDSNLLCWAARRGYSDLISCISQRYMEVCEMSPNENLLEDATQALAVSLLWKVALWCATRHGQGSVVIGLTSPEWVKESIDFNDYTGIEGCLPPLHLVSLLGDRSMLSWLCMGKMGIESGAYKTDYLGKTPLDYAMQFQVATKNSKEGVNVTNDIKDKMQFHHIIRYSTTWPEFGYRRPQYGYDRPKVDSYWTQHNSYNRGEQGQYYPYDREEMPMPNAVDQSCIQQLLQMDDVADRLKELNDMYITQANFVLVGAALIASVTFGGWLQPPLGYTDYFQFTTPNPLAPEGTYEQYVAVEGHLSVQMFVAFNTLSFFLGIGTMLIGAKATMFLHDNDERTIALMKVRKSIKWMLGFFITSMVCIMAAFICAGLAILPPIQRLEWSMIVSLCLGASICLIPLTWILFSLARDQIVKLKDWMVKLVMPLDKEKKQDGFLKDFKGSLLGKEDMKAFQECVKAFQEYLKTLQNVKPCTEPSSLDEETNSPYRDRLNRDRLHIDKLYGLQIHGARFYGAKLFGDKLVVRSPSPCIQRRHSWA